MKANFLLLAFLGLASFPLAAQITRNPTGVPGFLTIAPDARAAGLGNAGTALGADANATYWNPAKLITAERQFGASATYTPWLTNLIDGMWLGYASGYAKIGAKNAVGISANYFNSKLVAATMGTANGSEVALAGSYARQLGANFSMAFTLKYISSNPYSGLIINGNAWKPGRVVAGDISALYHNERKNSEGELTSWSVGAILADLGDKIRYGPGSSFPLPTRLRLGGAFSHSFAANHQLNVVADLGKLLVPTPQTNGAPRHVHSTITGIWKSFSDAPGGFKEEVQEITLGAGAEYWYKQKFALRGGYYGENKNKGNLRYFTTGAGVRVLKNYGADFSIMFPLESDNSLSKTYRITLLAGFGKKRS